MSKVKILVLGPIGCGKTRISNYLADATTGNLPSDLRPTQGARILEFDVSNLKVNNNNNDVEVQLWDCSGDEKYLTCWPAIRKNSNGIIFIYSPNDPSGIRKLELFYNYFVTQLGLSPRQCIVFSHVVDQEDKEDTKSVKLTSNFQRISHASVNLDSAAEKLRFDFNQFLTSVVNNM